MFNMQISSQTDNRNSRKNVATNNKYILRMTMNLKLPKPKFNIWYKIAFWNKQKKLKMVLETSPQLFASNSFAIIFRLLSPTKVFLQL